MPYTPASPCSVSSCPARAVERGRCAVHAALLPHMQGGDWRPYSGEWRRTRLAWLRDHPECERCGGMASEVHHAVAVARGGGSEADNLVSLCKACHSSLGRWGRGV
mgnify:CR=1 FL=1